MPSGSSSASGASSHRITCGPPWSGGVVLVVAAAVDDERGHLAVALGATRQPAASAASRSSSASAGQPAITTSAVAAGLGRVGSSGRCSPSSGYSYQPRPVLRPWSPEATLRAASIEGRQRGSPNDCA